MSRKEPVSSTFMASGKCTMIGLTHLHQTCELHIMNIVCAIHIAFVIAIKYLYDTNNYYFIPDYDNKENIIILFSP